MEIIRTIYDAFYNFFTGFSSGEISFPAREFLNQPPNWNWVAMLFAVGAAYVFLFILLPLFTWERYLKGKPSLFRFWFAFLTQTFFVVNAVLLLSLIKICNVFTLAAAVIGYTVAVRCHGRWRKIGSNALLRLDIYRRVAGGKYGFRLLLRNDFEVIFSRAGVRLKAFFKHIGRHLPEYILLTLLLAANLWFYSYGVLHYNSFGFGDEYTHSGWIYQISQGNVFSSGIYPFAMHCKIYSLHTLFGIGLHESVLYFGIMETMMMLLGIYSLLRTISRRKYTAIIAVLFASFAGYAPILVIRRFQWSLPEECAIYLIFPAAIFLIRWLRDDVVPEAAFHSGPIKFVRSFFNRGFFTDNLILFIISVSLVVATHFYTAIIAAIICIVICIAFLSRLIEQDRLFPLMAAVCIAGIATVLPYIVAIFEGKFFEASIEWALNIAGASASGGASFKLYFMLGAALIVAILFATAICWGLAQIHGKRDKKRYTDKIISSATGVFLTAVCAFVFIKADDLGLLRFVTIVRANFISSGLLGHQWGMYIIYTCAALLAFGLISLIFGQSDRAKTTFSMLISYFLIVTLYCLPQLGFPQIMDQIRVSIFVVVLTPVIIALAIDHIIDFPRPWFIMPFVNIFKKQDNDSMEKVGKFRGFLNKKRVRITLKIIAEIDMTVLCLSMAAVLFVSGQFHELTEMEYTQYNAAAECARRIVGDYDDYTWTLVSPTDEMYQVINHGYHEETVTMVSEIDHKDYYTIPSEYLFFFVEKNVINYAQTLEFIDGKVIATPVSYEDAMKNFVLSSSFTTNYSRNRCVVMSKMYYWAQAFSERYPNELKVYFENDNFVCYMLKQNTYSLFNLDVDYGYSD